MNYNSESVPFIVKSLERSLHQDDEDGWPGMSFCAPNGRSFVVSFPNDETYFLEELSPSGMLYFGKDPGEFKPDDFKDWPLHDQYKDDPNGYVPALRADGYSTDVMCASGSGRGVNSRYFDSLEDVAGAIIEAMNSNVRYSSDDPDLVNDEEHNRRVEAEADLLSQQWSEFHEGLHEDAKEQESGIFNGLCGMLGPLSAGAKERILGFLNSPSSETWDNAYSISLNGGTTLWQLWMSADPANAPVSKPFDEKWEVIPDPEVIRGAMRALSGNPDIDPSEDDRDDVVVPLKF